MKTSATSAIARISTTAAVATATKRNKPAPISVCAIVRDEIAHRLAKGDTLCDLAGLKTPDTVQFRSVLPVIRDGGSPFRDHLYFAFMSWQRAMRDGRYKLIEYCVKGQRHTQLFDLERDPSESNNLAADAGHADILGRLRKTLRAESILLNDGNTPHPFSDKMGKSFWGTYDQTTR